MEEEYDDSYELGETDAFSNVAAGLTGRNKTAMVAYWQQVIDSIERIGEDGSEVDSFKSTALPLARIKKVMKTDADVCMISAEAPILFAKGCDIFITELTMRAWIHAEESKRRTLQRSDIANALQKSDMFDFLIDIVPREEAQPRRFAPPSETGQPPQGSAPGIQGPLPGIQGPALGQGIPGMGAGIGPGIPSGSADGVHDVKPLHPEPSILHAAPDSPATPGHNRPSHPGQGLPQGHSGQGPSQGPSQGHPNQGNQGSHQSQPERQGSKTPSVHSESTPKPGEDGDMAFINQTEFSAPEPVKMEPPFEEFSYTTYPENSPAYNDENNTYADGYRDY